VRAVTSSKTTGAFGSVMPAVRRVVETSPEPVETPMPCGGCAGCGGWFWLGFWFCANVCAGKSSREAKVTRVSAPRMEGGMLFICITS
jgi:hypothetical protein